MVDKPDIEDYFTKNVISRDFFEMCCGDMISWGCSRAVYELRINPVYVVKFEYKGDMFQNVLEYDLWRYAKPDVRRWLAPCWDISTNGAILIQKRTTPIPNKFKFPQKIPSFLSDYKAENYGLFDGRLVCHDYGTHDSYEKRLKLVSSKSLVNVIRNSQQRLVTLTGS